MARPRILLIVLAGGKGSRLELLTESRAKPAVPYAGHYRLIDVPLSNALHSQIADVWVIEQYNPVSLIDHLANGRPWDLDRTTGGLRLLHPRQGGRHEGWASGTADSLWRNADLVREFAADALVVVSSDAVYRLDYDAVVQQHLETGATVTMVTTRVEASDASRYGVVRVKDGRVTDYAYKPESPAGDLVTNEVFVFDPGPTLDLLESLADEVDEEGLQDLGNDLLPRLVAAGSAREYRLEGYWRDLGTISSYWQAHMDLVAESPPFAPDDAEWPIVTLPTRLAPARLLAGSSVSEALLSSGLQVAGTVERSVLSPGVVVEPGAVVRDSVLLSGTVVRRGATVTRAILDSGVQVGEKAQVGAPDGEITLIGSGEVVAEGEAVPAGARRG